MAKLVMERVAGKRFQQASDILQITRIQSPATTITNNVITKEANFAKFIGNKRAISTSFFIFFDQLLGFCAMEERLGLNKKFPNFSSISLLLGPFFCSFPSPIFYYLF